MNHMFQDGGFGMYPTAVAGLLLLAVAIRYAVRPEDRWVPLQVALAIMTLSMGAASFVTGLISTTTSIDMVREKAAIVGALGFGESLNNLALALSLIAIASVATTVGAARRMRMATA
jgi:hypothetical protein